MRPTRITYDPDGDVLYITFGQATSSTGHQLSDQLLLRVDPKTEQASGLTIFNYSHHSSAGSEIFLPGLDVEDNIRAFLLNILTSPPVTQFLVITTHGQKVSAKLLSPSLQQAVAG